MSNDPILQAIELVRLGMQEEALATYSDIHTRSLQRVVTKVSADDWLVLARLLLGLPVLQWYQSTMLTDLLDYAPDPTPQPPATREAMYDVMVRVAKVLPPLASAILLGKHHNESSLVHRLDPAVVARCLDTQANLWQHDIRHNTFWNLETCTLGEEPVRKVLLESYRRYLATDPEPESLPYKVFHTEASSAYKAAIFFPFILSPELHPENTEITRLARKFPRWFDAHKLVPWFRNPNLEAMPGDARLTPEVCELLRALYQWPVISKYERLTDTLFAPSWVVKGNGFNWSPHTITQGSLKVCVTGSTVYSSRAKSFVIHRLTQSVGIVAHPNKLSDSNRQLIRLLEGLGLELLSVVDAPVTASASDLLFRLLHRTFVSNWDWGTLNIAGDLDPHLAAQYAKWLLPLAQAEEHAVLAGIRKLDKDWFTVVSRYLPDYVPLAGITAMLAK